MTMQQDEIGQAIAREISHSIAKRIAIGIALSLAFLIFIVIGSLVVQFLWNWLVPDIFGLRRVTWLESLGLLALSRIMFGGFGRGGGSHRRSARHDLGARGWWKGARPPAAPVADPASPGNAPSASEGS
jgi:hypothetical protein